MKKIISACLGLVMIAMTSGYALADTSAAAVAHVAVNVVPTVGVSVQTPAIPYYQVGGTEPSIDVIFSIHSNSEQLSLSAAASKLYKGDVPTSAFFLERKDGVKFVCANANPINGASNTQPYAVETSIGNFPALQTASLVFESADRGTFSQSCTLTFQWTSNDFELPVGQYSGMVKLIACILPNGGPVLR
jgi:hypothetical protein